MTWWPALLGWPAIALSIILSVIGIKRRNEYLVLAAIVPIIPFGFYILGSPLFWWLPVAVLVVLLLLSWSIRRSYRKVEKPD
jgi:membrane protein implicated in regulation of membrane protease activity